MVRGAADGRVRRLDDCNRVRDTMSTRPFVRRTADAHGADALESAPTILTPGWECTLLRRDAIEAALALRGDTVPELASLTAALDALVVVPGFVHRMAPLRVGGTLQVLVRKLLVMGRLRALGYAA